MTEYWVIGGEYTDTTFETIAGGGKPEEHGPFESHEVARQKWAALSMADVDNAHVRFSVVKKGSATFWVVGGVYKSTEFQVPADGGQEERLGPFDSEDEAIAVWRAKAMETVDDAHARYRIERV